MQVTARFLVIATGVKEEKMEWNGGVFGLRRVSRKHARNAPRWDNVDHSWAPRELEAKCGFSSLRYR